MFYTKDYYIEDLETVALESTSVFDKKMQESMDSKEKIAILVKDFQAAQYVYWKFFPSSKFGVIC